jgi:hypothetical protein
MEGEAVAGEFARKVDETMHCIQQPQESGYITPCSPMRRDDRPQDHHPTLTIKNS